MYKTRLKIWGLTKNLAASDVPDILHTLATTGKDEYPTDLVIRGQKVALAKVKHYLKRTPRDRAILDSRRMHASQKQRPRAVEPLLHRMDPPDDLRLPESIIQISARFIAGGVEGIWAQNVATPKFSASTSIIDWLDKMYGVMSYLRQKHNIQAFADLNTCFDRFKLLLVEPTPTLFVQLYYIIIWLPSDIGQRLLEYAAQMSTIVLPVNHPLRLVWTILHRAGIKRVVEHAWMILNSHLLVLAEWFQDYTMELIDVYHHTDDRGPGTVESTEPWQMRKVRPLPWAEYLPRCQLCLTWVLYRSKNYDQVSVKSNSFQRLVLITTPSPPP
jgi:hypothetical protein